MTQPSSANDEALPRAAKLPATPARVLLVDDEPLFLTTYARCLGRAGHDVVTARSGRRATELLAAGGVDVVVSDIGMPEMNGVELLRAVREQDLDVPVVLMTGAPSVESAVEAVEYGALRYLYKPVAPAMLEEVVTQAAILHRLARVRRETLDLLGNESGQIGDRAGLEARFAQALDQMWMEYQPIVHASDSEVFGYEALLRTSEPTLRNPAEFVTAAARLARLPDLGRKIRASVAAAIDHAPASASLFVNLHAIDLLDEELYQASSPLARRAERVVLEITERASLETVGDVRARVASLRRLGFRIAVDDLGAGYAGLTSFAQLEPDLVKLDMCLVRGCEASVTKQKLIRSIAGLCSDLGITTVMEGIETEAERTQLRALGGDLFQGYLFARPSRSFTSSPRR